MSAVTARTFQAGKAPKRLDLLGDKTIRPEPAQHIITFPGGAIELSRTSDGNYWAHILINRGWALEDQEGFHAATGEVLDSRLDRDDGEIPEIDRASDLRQIAVLIRPTRPGVQLPDPI